MPYSKTSYTASDKMRDLIRDNARLLPAISRFNIAFGFGDAPVEDVCRKNGVDTPTFLNVCNLLSDNGYDPDRISLATLMGYLKRAHSSFLDVTLPKIRINLIEAINGGEANEVALMLIQFFDDYVVEVKSHMDHENNVIFSYVEGLLEGKADSRFSIDRFSVNHGHMAAKLNELKDLFIYHYKQKENARLSAVLFDIIQCERDLMSHFEVEKNLFIPAVEKLEQSLRTAAATCDTAERASDSDSGIVGNLSKREIEVIRAVALGKSNKEIADELFISVHTVATHRKNINSKLGIHSTAGLALFAVIHHIVDISEVTPL